MGSVIGYERQPYVVTRCILLPHLNELPDPICGRPMQVLLSFLTGPRISKGLKWVSLELGCNPRYRFARITAGAACEAYTSRPAFRRWAGRGKYANLPLPAPAER